MLPMGGIGSIIIPVANGDEPQVTIVKGNHDESGTKEALHPETTTGATWLAH